MDIIENEKNVQYFLDLIKKSRRGKFKLYIGMIAGVGKSYRMLQEAHELLENGVDVKVGFIETHGRTGTEAILQGIPVIPRKKIFYKGKELEEMDLDAILQIRPELVIVDELAHTNVEGSRNEKRWQDVMELLDAIGSKYPTYRKPERRGAGNIRNRSSRTNSRSCFGRGR